MHVRTGVRSILRTLVATTNQRYCARSTKRALIPNPVFLPPRSLNPRRRVWFGKEATSTASFITGMNHPDLISLSKMGIIADWGFDLG